MKYAINIPHFGDCADARVLADLARVAEEAGWDGFFIWDHIALDWPDAVVDVTVALTAIALATEHIRFGALVTPLARRRPTKFAREMVTLDHLSGGRLIVGVGLGIHESEFEHLGDESDQKVRAAMLDEALTVITGLWSGEGPFDTFTHDGHYYKVHEARFWPKPVQQPRPPIWVAGMWPNKPPLRRAACWDAVYPILADGDEMTTLTPDEMREINAYVREHRSSQESFDSVVHGLTPGDDLATAADMVRPYIDAGVTWWQEAVFPLRFDWEPGPAPWPMDAMRERIRQGPPSVS